LISTAALEAIIRERVAHCERLRPIRREEERAQRFACGLANEISRALLPLVALDVLNDLVLDFAAREVDDKCRAAAEEVARRAIVLNLLDLTSPAPARGGVAGAGEE
jgi:hypothetical protein